MHKVVIIGAGGFGREVLDVLEAVNQVSPTYEIMGFISDPDYHQPDTMINDAPVLGGFDWLADQSAEVKAICGVGIPATRQKLIQQAADLGVQFFNVIHPRAITTRWMTLGEGSIITAGCILTNNITIGSHVHLNLDCTIGHDAVIENFVTVSPGAHISGNVTLKQGSFIGTGANIIEGKTIGEGSVIGAGSVVVKDIPDHVTAIGIPAIPIKTHPEE